MSFRAILGASGALGFAACAATLMVTPANSEDAKPAITATGFEAGYGPNPVLPTPDKSLIPTVNVAKAKPWTGADKPVAAGEFEVTEFARDLDHPRWLYTLPNGDILVAESNAPPKPKDSGGIKGWFMKIFMGKAGAVTPSANRITLYRPTSGAPERHQFLQNLNSPFGMALAGERLYVANTDAIVSFPYKTGDVEITAAPEKLIDLPAGARNRHWTKGLIANKDGTKLYATVGSNSNVAENGMNEEAGRALILEVDIKAKTSREFATGLRNPNGLAWQPQSGALWTTVNERDELGNDLVPDYMTSVKDGAFYGWPYSYFGQHLDDRVKPPKPDLVAKVIAPDYALGAHTASLGLAFASGDALPEKFRNGAFVAQHGSWNRKPVAGYKVIFIPFADGKPSGPPQDVLTGFLSDQGDAQGRPVGLTFDKTGALLVADDVGNRIWKLTPKSGNASASVTN